MAHGRTELVEVIREVRVRWRRRLAARGALVVLAGTVLALLVSASGLEQLRFSPAAIIVFRVLVVGVFAALGAYALVKPLRRKVTESQVAMYLEERNPSLEAAILSALEATAVDPATASHSPKLVERLVEQAIEQCRRIDHSQSIDHASFRRHVMTFTAVAAAACLLVVFGPSYLRQGISALIVVYRSAEAATPYHIEVRPGDAKVPRGGDQGVHARLLGFASKDVSVMMRTATGAPFERVPLVATANPAMFEGMMFHLDKDTEYFVVSNGVESPRYHLSVVDLPTVSTMDLEYHFPAYTNLPPRKVEGGGDVAALTGTTVAVRIVPTMKTPGGSILVKDGPASPLTAQPDGSLTGRFTIDKDGFYRIELIGPHGEKVEASPQYTIDVLEDQPPAVSFSKPGRDTQASPVEEVFAEVKADDDFGVKSLQLFYSVNGGSQKSVSLFGGGKALTEVNAGHTIYLEELDLKPGDFVSYFAKATDNDTVPGPQTSSSDIYFVQIRPFKKDYKQAQSQASGGGGGQQGAVGDLSRQQREIVAATFNTVRDKAKTKADKYRENVVFLNLAQAKLREQVDELVGKLKARLGAIKSENFTKIAEQLPKASAEMKTAEGDLKALKPDNALAPEQRALKILQEAEQQYEVEISAQNGGGGGGSQQANSEDLADLFELELDKLANQYEMQKRAEQQTGDHQIDQLAEKLKELARRQQQEAERQRRLSQSGAQGGQSGQGGQGSSAGGQRSLADEAQEAARRLQQLSREQQRPDLAEAARQMQQAADQMRQAAASGNRDGGAQANAALEKLREAQRKLEQNQTGRSERDIQNARQKAHELADEQKDVAAQVNGLEQASGQAGAQTGAQTGAQMSAGERQAKAQSLEQRKDAMDAKLGDLQKQIEALANDTRRDEREASRKLDEAAGAIRDKKIREKIRYSRGTLQGRPSEYARGMEQDIGSNLTGLEQKLSEAAGAMGQKSKADSLTKASEQARNLVRSMESLDQRMKDRQQGQQGQRAEGKGQQGQGKEQEGKGQGQQGQGQGKGQEGQGQQGGGPMTGNPGGASGDARNRGAQGGREQGDDARGFGQARFTNDDVRQFRREYQEMTRDAQQLRQQLQAAGINPKDFDDVLRNMRQMNEDGPYADPGSLAKLQAESLDKLKRFEFGLRRKIEGGNESLALSGSDEVPAGFRQAIEEYYRSLAKAQSK